MSAFAVLRIGAAAWPPPLQPRLPIEVTGANTLVLLASSVYMALAVRSFRRGGVPLAASRLARAAALGGLFLAVQGYEWVRLIGFGLTASSGAYGGTFYTLIGAHALHVVGALAWLGVAVHRVRAGYISPDRPAGLRACAMYWHFVVGLWPILYVTVYLV
jgi:heme/copper-type cytochrome/quinol oxidase subunit 3